MKTNELKQYHKNPRTISKTQFDLLTKNLDELGDLGGIVHDLNSDEIIGGNQRIRVLTDCEIVIIEKFEQPTRTGTVALGYVIHNGEKYSYRQVRWTPRQAEKANITANKISGEFDFDILANEFDASFLVAECGFTEKELISGTFGSEDEPSFGKDKELVTCPNCRHQFEV